MAEVYRTEDDVERQRRETVGVQLMTGTVGCARQVWSAGFLTTVAAMLLTACAAAPADPPRTPPEALARATQLLVVTTTGWDSTTGELRRFVRDDVGSAWRREGSAVPVVVGRSGLAWGVGFDSLAADGATTAGPRKREGDGRSPAGAFALDRAFGFASPDSTGSFDYPYLPLAPGTECVDDPRSEHYNRVLDRGSVPDVDWTSAERMREISLYRLGVIVDYNPAPVPGRGSCIFLHVWEGPRSTTVGCTAMDGDALAELVAWLDPRSRPVLVQLPATVYSTLREEWRLPAL